MKTTQRADFLVGEIDNEFQMSEVHSTLDEGYF